MRYRFIIAGTFLFLLSLQCYGQGSGIGYMLDLGVKKNFKVASGYSQSMETITHNGFIRFHNEEGNNAVQFQIGFRTDSINFENYSDFLSDDNLTMDSYMVTAYLKRHAWKFSLLNQFQMGKRPGKFMFAINTGIFYEYTQDISRHGITDEVNYELNDEINRHNFGMLLGTEIRFSWFTIGYKYEKMFFDMLNHNVINSCLPGHYTCNELRGLKLNPGMSYFYLGINIDIFY